MSITGIEDYNDLHTTEKRSRRVGYLAGLIGMMAALAGLVIILVNYVLKSYLPADLWLILPASFRDLLSLLTALGIALGVFAFAWGMALVSQRAWGLYASTVSLALLCVYLVGAAWLWFTMTGMVLPWNAGPGGLNFQSVVLLAFIIAAGLILVVTLWLTFNSNLREVYAVRYGRMAAKSGYAMCEVHGLIREKDGACLICDRFKVELSINPDIAQPAPIYYPLTRTQPAVTLGRSPDCEVYLNENEHPEYRGISRQHAELTYDFDRGMLLLEDIGSSHGTICDGRPLAAGEICELPDDRAHEVTLAGVRFMLQVTAAA